MKPKHPLLMGDGFIHRGQTVAPPVWLETRDLRKRPIYRERAVHYPYTCPAPSIKQTHGLPIGTQAELIAAARRSADAGHPINTLLSARWDALLINDDLNPLRTMQTPERIRHIVELLRKWLTNRGIPANYFWVREVSDKAGEHWHFAFHLPRSKRTTFTAYIEQLLVEPIASGPRSNPNQTRGEFACSECGSWHLAGEVPDGKPQFAGYWIAAYLGKGEPSQRLFRGKLVNNTRKPVRGREFGGRVKGDRYDAPQGDVRGTTTRKARFDIARSLKQNPICLRGAVAVP
jgi:hypothetical protein